MSAKKNISIFWFRQDLRLADNPGLTKAVENGSVLPVYIYDNVNSKEYEMGAASKWWLHHSLGNLNKSLNNNLSIYVGDPQEILRNIINNYNVESINWNRCYEPWRIQRDQNIKCKIEEQGIEVNTFNGSLLWEPFKILKNDGTPYRVFSPYYRKGCLNAEPPRVPIKSPSLDSLINDDLSLIHISEPTRRTPIS